MARHTLLSNVLWKIMTEAGYQAKREVHVPEWRRWNGRKQNWEHAYLDVVGVSHLTQRARYIDVSIRHPAAHSYQPEASARAGVAAREAERCKSERYPPKGGLFVTPAAIEIYGLAGQQFTSLLGDLSAAASEERRSRGMPPRSSKFRWLTALSVALALCCAESLIEGAGSSSGGEEA